MDKVVKYECLHCEKELDVSLKVALYVKIVKCPNCKKSNVNVAV